MKEPFFFFFGLVVLKEWKILGSCLRMWKKRSRSNGQTLVDRVLTNIQCFIPPERHGHCCRCSPKASGHTGRRRHIKTSKLLVPQGAPCWGHPPSVPTHSTPAGFISCGFTVRTNVMNEPPRERKEDEEWDQRLITNGHKGARFHFHHWCALFCSSGNISPG